MMKNAFIFLFVLALGFYLFWQFSVAPIVASNTECFSHESFYLDDVGKNAKSMQDASLRLKYVCESSKESYIRLKSCLATSESKNTLGKFIIENFPIPKYRPSTYLADAANKYYKVCSTYSLE